MCYVVQNFQGFSVSEVQGIDGIKDIEGFSISPFLYFSSSPFLLFSLLPSPALPSPALLVFLRVTGK